MELYSALSYLEAAIGALESDSAMLLEAWYYLVRVLPCFGNIEEVAAAYNKHFAKNLNHLHVLDVMVYLTPTYDLESVLSILSRGIQP